MRFRAIVPALAFLWLPSLGAAAETVRVAHPLLAPFTYVQVGKTVGLVADILRAAAAREGIDLVFVPETPAQLTETLSNGTTEAIAPMPIGSQKYDFTTAFVITGGALFVRAGAGARGSGSPLRQDGDHSEGWAVRSLHREELSECHGRTGRRSGDERRVYGEPRFGA